MKNEYASQRELMMKENMPRHAIIRSRQRYCLFLVEQMPPREIEMKPLRRRAIRATARTRRANNAFAF